MHGEVNVVAPIGGRALAGAVGVLTDFGRKELVAYL
jgi:hypothetical protein